MLQSRKNRLTGFQDMMQGILAASQYHDALKYRDKALGIWSDEVNNNKVKPIPRATVASTTSEEPPFYLRRLPMQINT